MISSLRFIMNKRTIFQACSNYIHHWEGYAPGKTYEDVILRHINRYMDENKTLIAAQRNTDIDFRVFVLKLIAKVTYDMIASFVHHSSNLDYIHNKAMEELLTPGFITQREFDEDKNTLKSIVHEHDRAAHKEYYESMARMKETLERLKDASDEKQDT